jgi:hypothetical protein
MNYQAIRDFLTDFFKARLAEERLRVAEVGRMDEWRRIALRNTRDFSKDALETKCYLLGRRITRDVC